MKMFRFKSIVAAMLIAMSLNVTAQNKEIHFVAINDIHACMDRSAALGGVIDSLRALYPNLMVLSAGDNRTGDPVSDMYMTLYLLCLL